MQSTAATVDAYIEEAPAERQAALRQLRELCRETLPGYTETMTYGMPCYSRDGTVQAIEVSFASQKNYLSLYILKQDVLDAHRPELQGISIGKGCIRYSKPGKIDYAVVRRMLEETVASSSPAC